MSKKRPGKTRTARNNAKNVSVKKHISNGGSILDRLFGYDDERVEHFGSHESELPFIITNDNIHTLVRTYIIATDELPEDLRMVPIGTWDVSRVTNMDFLFGIGPDNVAHESNVQLRAFNQPIGQWNVSNVTSMKHMFEQAGTFNQPIGQWDVSRVTDMNLMFFYAYSFNQPIGGWNVHNVIRMGSMFQDALAFNQPIGDWNTSNVTTMAFMFMTATAFNQPIGQWNVSNVTDMRMMFSDTPAFNQPIGDWNTSNVINMNFMFSNTPAFNQPIGQWDVSRVNIMRNMFLGATSFNQPIGQWNVSNVTNMEHIFDNARAFNQPIGQWNVSNVTNMNSMFVDAISFNQPIRQWNVSNVNSMINMFDGATSFNQDYPGFPPAVAHAADRAAALAAARAADRAAARAAADAAGAPVRIARTIEDYMSMCLTSDKTADVCRDSICQVCQEKFIVRGHLIRPVMFHRSVNSSGNETWVHPVHPEEQVQWGSQGPRGVNTCMECRDQLYIPASLRTDIMTHRNAVIEGSEATSGALRLQSAFRGHQTRRSIKPQDGGKKNKKHVRKVKTLRKTRRNRK